ncbi:MAG: peptidoglycan DD-metalloendopeptidase family protein [Patescibacteria group bacterium]
MSKVLIVSVIMMFAAIVFISFSPAIQKTFQPEDKLVTITVPNGATFAVLLNSVGIATSTANQILENSKDVYDFSKIVSGREMAFTFAHSDGVLRRLVYNIDTEERLTVEIQSEITVATSSIPYKVKQEEVSGIIQTSLYESFVENNLDVRLALSLAEMFAWQVDFAADIRTGDSFKAIYEKRFLDGEYVMPGNILAAKFINDKKEFRGYYFASENTKAAYYDENGNSLQKEFLKSPLQYKYISSGFTYARINPITKKVSPHRGIDYAANYGTPAVSVGDGTVTQAGWNSYYGISVTIRHNDTYKTVYGHFANLAKGIRVGAKVRQGQVVGYVGATGQATGPHLHYEMHKFGNYVNPFLVDIPPGEPIAEADRAAFEELKQKYDVNLN